MSDRERAAHAAATTDGDGARLRPPKTAQPPAASLTQAGRFLVLDREKRVADGELGRCFQLPERRFEIRAALRSRAWAATEMMTRKHRGALFLLFFSPVLRSLSSRSRSLSARSLDPPTHSLAIARARPFPLTHTQHTETFEDKRRRRRASKAQSEFSKRKKDGAFSGFFTPPGQGTKSMFLFLLIPSFLLFPFEPPFLPFPFAFHLRLWAPLRSLRRRASPDPERGDRQGSRPPSDPETQKKEKGKQGRGGARNQARDE